MKKCFIALSVVTFGCFVSPHLAVAEVFKASMSTSLNQTQKCDATTCSGHIKFAAAATHSFTLTPLQESTLETSTLINLNLNDTVFNFRLGDDPDFVNGDTSANISNIQHEGEVEIKITGKVKWGGGKMDINLKATAQGDVVLARPWKETKSVVPKEPNILELETTIQTPSQPDLVVTSPLACDQSVSGKESITAEGNTDSSLKQSMKSRSFAPTM